MRGCAVGLSLPHGNGNQKWRCPKFKPSILVVGCAPLFVWDFAVTVSAYYSRSWIIYVLIDSLVTLHYSSLSTLSRLFHVSFVRLIVGRQQHGTITIPLERILESHTASCRHSHSIVCYYISTIYACFSYYKLWRLTVTRRWPHWIYHHSSSRLRRRQGSQKRFPVLAIKRGDVLAFYP